MKITINYEGNLYEVEDSEDVISRIINEPSFARIYTESHLAQNDEIGINTTAAVNTGVAADECVPGCSSAPSIESEPESNWDHKTVLLFLDECNERRTDLRNPKLKRRSVFQGIRQRMKLKGYHFTEQHLDKKLQNLKTHYNKVVDNNKKTSTGRGRISWPYFQIMRNIYEAEARVHECPTYNSLAAESPGPSLHSLGSLSNSSTSHSLSPSSSASASPIEMPSTSRRRKAEEARSQVLNMEARKLSVAEALLAEIREIKEMKRRQMEIEERRLALEERKYQDKS